MNLINLCTKSVRYIAQCICYLFNRLVACCKGEPKAKKALATDSNLKIAKEIKICDRKVSRPIYLIKGNHFIGNKQADFTKYLLQLAAMKKLIYAMEGLERDTQAEKEFKDCVQTSIKGMSDGYLYGIEDPFFNIFNSALDLNNLLRGSSNDLPSEIINQKKIDLLCLLVSEINQKHLQKFWNNDVLNNNTIFTSLKKQKTALLQQPLLSLNNLFATVIGKWNKETWFNFTKEISLIFGETLQTILPKEKLQTLNTLLESLKTFGLNSSYTQSTSKLYTFMTQLHLTLRNDFLTANFKTIHEITAETEKPIASVLGDEHIEGITDALNKEGYTVLGLKELKEQLKKV